MPRSSNPGPFRFKVGEVVRLKSGGPKMTVMQLGTSGLGYQCQWFSGSKLSTGFFPEENLELVVEETPK